MTANKIKLKMLVPPVSTDSSADLFFLILLANNSIKVYYCMGRYISLTPVNQPRRQLGEGSFSRWHYTWLKRYCISQDKHVGFEHAFMSFFTLTIIMIIFSLPLIKVNYMKVKPINKILF